MNLECRCINGIGLYFAMFTVYHPFGHDRLQKRRLSLKEIVPILAQPHKVLDFLVHILLMSRFVIHPVDHWLLLVFKGSKM